MILGLKKFMVGSESHELWIEKRGNKNVVMMASDPVELSVKIKGFYVIASKIKDEDKKNEVLSLIGKLKQSIIKLQDEKATDEASSSYIKLIDGQSPWPEGFVPKNKVLKSGDTFHMALDSTQPVTSPGSFATVDNIPNVDYVRNNLAVKSDWKADCSKVVTYSVKKVNKYLCLKDQLDLK